MATGRVLQFDQTRGYGFVAADDGGEDVFLHASVFDGDSSALVPGMRVKFQVMAGDRGRKAFAAHLVADEPDPGEEPVLPPPSHQAIPGSALPASDVPDTLDDDQMCDVLSQSEFRQELTELLLNAAPPLSGPQILKVRQDVLKFAQKHGWVDT